MNDAHDNALDDKAMWERWSGCCTACSDAMHERYEAEERERWEYPTEEQAERMAEDAREQYAAYCAELGVKPDHDDECDDDNPCGECRADLQVAWEEDRWDRMSR